MALQGGPAEGRAGAGSSSSTLRRALTWYVIWSLVALALVSAAAVVLSIAVARDEALDDARSVARGVANQIVAPLGTAAFHSGEAEAQRLFTTVLDNRRKDGSLRHIKVWADAGPGRGQVVWADETALVGQTFDLDGDEYELFRTQQAVSSISDLSKEENALERADLQLVEVYAGLTDVSGANLLFEAYLPTDTLTAKTTSLIAKLLPLMVGSLVLLELTTLPLAVSLARRVDRSQAEREHLLQHAIDSSDLERRRIAQDLHDGVIQDLAGVGYALSALSRRIDDEELAGSLDRASSTVQRDVVSLRTLMTDIYPPDLDSRGLPDAVRDLIGQSAYAGTDVELDVDEPLTPSPVTARLAFRVVRESLRNVVGHSGARSASVRLAQDGDRLLVDITDDGHGFDTAAAREEGHLGQQLLHDSVADAGGTLLIESSPGAGTRVSASLPL